MKIDNDAEFVVFCFSIMCNNALGH